HPVGIRSRRHLVVRPLHTTKSCKRPTKPVPPDAQIDQRQRPPIKFGGLSWGGNGLVPDPIIAFLPAPCSVAAWEGTEVPALPRAPAGSEPRPDRAPSRACPQSGQARAPYRAAARDT